MCNRPLAKHFIAAAVEAASLRPWGHDFCVMSQWRAAWVGEPCGHRNVGRPNGLEVNPRGQGPRGYGSAAHGLPACESRVAGRAPPCGF